HPAVLAEKVQFVYLRFFSVAVTAFCRGRGLMPGKCKSWPREGTRLRAVGAPAFTPGHTCPSRLTAQPWHASAAPVASGNKSPTCTFISASRPWAAPGLQGQLRNPREMPAHAGKRKIWPRR